MDRYNFNSEMNNILTFNENESNKVSGIKKVFVSKPFIILMISFLLFLITSVGAIVVGSVTDPSFTTSDIGLLIFSVLLEMVLPLLFLWLLFLCYQVSKGIAKPKYNNSVLTRIFALRRYAKIFLILMAVCCIVDGIYMMNMETIYYANEATFQQMGTTFDSDTIASYVAQGRHYLFQGIAFAFLAYGSLSAFKVLFRSVILDERENKYIEFWIISGLLVVYALLMLLGNVLALAGVSTFLTSSTLNPHSVGDVLSFIAYIILAFTLIIGAYNIYLMRKALIENYGSSNPLASCKVYTIDLDEENKEDEENKVL